VSQTFTRVVAAGVALGTPAIITTGATNLYWFRTATTLTAMLLGLFWLPRFRRVDEDRAGGAQSAVVVEKVAPPALQNR
jgi:uncharacterized membrane protein